MFFSFPKQLYGIHIVDARICDSMCVHIVDYNMSTEPTEHVTRKYWAVRLTLVGQVVVVYLLVRP